MTPPRTVLDTNVLVSGLLFSGPPHLLLRHVRERTIELVISASLVAELERVLRTKFPTAQPAIHDTLQTILATATRVIPTELLAVIADDPDDNRVLECALSAHADAIVSGDHHLLALQTFRDIPILTPRAFLHTLAR